MESPFVVSAPGKAILFGEHAAVYNKPAIAAAIGLRSYLRVATLPETRTAHLKFPDIGLDHAWDIDTLPWTCVPELPHGAPYNINSLDTVLFEAIRPHAEVVSMHLPEDKCKVHVRSATAFLYLFLLLASKNSPGAVYTLRSAVPIGAGLGSSASVCVCCSAALLLQNGAIAPPDASEEAKKDAELISRWAFVGELCMHGDPSGVDNAVSACGRAVLYQRNGIEPPTISPISSIPKLPIWLIDTGISRSTAAQVEKVRLQPVADTEPLLYRIELLTEFALEHFASADFLGSGRTEALRHLGYHITKNHELLVELGVSHSRLEGIVELIYRADLGWAKLTGAGGGGCAIALLDPDIEDKARYQLRSRLAAEGYGVYETVLGANGVGILGQSGAEGDLGGDYIEKVFAGDGVHGAEQQLVDLEKGNWKFWYGEELDDSMKYVKI